jgi:hypothetical protein
LNLGLLILKTTFIFTTVVALSSSLVNQPLSDESSSGGGDVFHRLQRPGRSKVRSVKTNVTAALLLVSSVTLLGWALLDWASYTTFSDSLLWWR